MRTLRLALSWTAGAVALRPWRFVWGALAVGAATALVALTLGFQRGFRGALDRNVEALGYQVLVTAQGCPHEAATLILRGGSIPMYVPEEVARRVIDQPEVAAATRFLLQAVPGPEPGATQLFLGIDGAYLDLKPGARMQRGSRFSDSHGSEVLLGFQVAEYRRLEVGDDFDVLGRPHRVVGVLDQLGTQDDGTVFLPLGRAQEVFEKRGRVTGIGLRLHDLSTAGALTERVLELPAVQVVRLARVHETVLGWAAGTRALLGAFAAAALVAAGLGVLAVALVNAAERSDELGLLRALGAADRTLFALAWFEAGAMGLGGLAAGLALALGLRGAAETAARSHLTFVPAGPVIELTAGVVLAASAAALAIALLAAAGPAWGAARRPPMDTLRRTG